VTDDGWWIDDIRAEWTVEESPGLLVQPDAHDFGEVEVGETVQKDFTVENPGDAELVFTPSIGGEDPSAYAVIGGGSEVSVPSGESTTVTAEFSPTEANQTFNAELLIDHNGAENVNENPYPVSLQGETSAEAVTNLQWIDESGTPVTEAEEGEPVSLRIETVGYPEGTVLLADIFEDDPDTPITGDDPRAQRELEVQADGTAQAEWSVRDDGGPGTSEFYFALNGQQSPNLEVIQAPVVQIRGSELNIAGEDESPGENETGPALASNDSPGFGSQLERVSNPSPTSTDGDAYYFSGGEAIPLDVSADRFIVRTGPSTSAREVLPTEASIQKRLHVAPQAGGETRLVEMRASRSVQEMKQLTRSLRGRSDVQTATPVYKSGEKALVAPGRVIAWFNPEVPREKIQTVLEEEGLEVMEEKDWAENLFYLRPTGEAGPLQTANALHKHTSLKYAHPDFATYSSSLGGMTSKMRNSNRNADGRKPSEDEPGTSSPDDEHYLEQWHLREMLAPAAWSTTRGNQDVTIAIIDDAVDVNHEDLSGNLVDQSRWRDTYDEDDDPTPENDLAAHGTAVAGIAAAVGNNEKGVAGVCPDCSILPVRTALDYDGTAADKAEGIVWAVQHGADVLNLSWKETDTPADYIRHSILYASDQGREGNGAVVVAASGNDGEEPVRSPATYSRVISVGYTDKEGSKGSISQYGENLDIMAPGKEIFTTDAVTVPGYDNDPGLDTTPDGKYVKNFGATSSASPSVAGIAGLMLSANSELSAKQVQSILQNTATDVQSGNASEGWDQYTGSGIADAYAAVRAASEGSYTNEGQITVVNGGSVDAEATAQASAGWLTLGTTSFTVPAGGQEVITADVDHSQINSPTTSSVEITLPEGEAHSPFEVSVEPGSN